MSTSYDSSRKRRSDTLIIPGSTSNKVAQGSWFHDDSSVPWSKPASLTMETSARNHAHCDKPVIRLKVCVERFHGVASWSWNANDDVCGICQSAFEGTAPGVKYPGEDCPVVWGKCGHAFHLQCVSKWLSQPSSKNSCPICRQEWEFGQNPVSAESRS